ncbi:MAG: putative DNA binding domain-containing protein [Fimbriimonadales bacterium]|nr:putative DNA binding domain-containing protein [Fimbriimonadales bacterium]
MNAKWLKTLISQGETADVEFKSEQREPLSDRELVETIVCLANRQSNTPGWLLIGVEDDGTITGAQPRDGRTINTDRLAALIGARTRPSLTVKIHSIKIQSKTVVAIEVPPQKTPVCTTNGVFLRRGLGGDGRPACLPMDFASMYSLQSDRGLLDPSAQIVADAQWTDLDPLEFERFRRYIRERRGRSDESLLDFSDLDIAKALGVVDANGQVRGVRLAAILLFGKEEAIRRFVPANEAAFQVIRGLEVEVNDFFRWPLFRVMEEFEARIRARNREKELMIGKQRIGVPDYSERALREALANALVHRDYLRLGAVHFQWYPDRIEISNPGGFPEGVRLDNLLVTAPRPRNPLLADAFKRAGIVERTARGIDTIFYEQLRNGHPAPSYERSDANSVVVVIHGGFANLDFVRFIINESRSGIELGVDELLILNTLWLERSLTTRTAASLIQKTVAATRAVLNRLVEAGILEARGSSREQTWQFSAAAYRALGDRAAYVRQRGFEPLQQEQMVLQYVEKHGRITRAEAAHLCRVGVYQASRLLRRLVSKGKLVKHGKLKHTWYERTHSV